MGLTTVTLLAAKLILYFVAALLIIAFVPGLPPHIDFRVIQYPEVRSLEGTLAPNSILDKAELILAEEVAGAESIVVDGDTIYFGSLGGNVYRYDDNGVLEKILQTGEPCDVVWEMRKCGWPLGIRLDKKKNLWIADAFKGILRIDLNTRQMETIVNAGDIIEGSAVAYSDDLDVDSKGFVYWSDGSKYSPEEAALEFIGGAPSGRVIRTNPKTGENTVLMRDIAFANGVQLSPNEDFLLVCETMRMRVLRFYLKGEKQGTWDVFVDRLPGLPDNVRPNGKGGFYISLVYPKDKTLEILGHYPTLRKLFLRVYTLGTGVINFLERYFPRNDYLTQANLLINDLVFFNWNWNLDAKVIIVETDVSGSIIGSLQNSESNILRITQATVGKNYVYFGSMEMPGIYRLNRTDLWQRNP